MSQAITQPSYSAKHTYQSQAGSSGKDSISCKKRENTGQITRNTVLKGVVSLKGQHMKSSHLQQGKLSMSPRTVTTKGMMKRDVYVHYTKLQVDNIVKDGEKNLSEQTGSVLRTIQQKHRSKFIPTCTYFKHWPLERL